MAALAEIQSNVPPHWTMSSQKIAIFVSLSIMSLVIALDANIIVTSLSVSQWRSMLAL